MKLTAKSKVEFPSDAPGPTARWAREHMVGHCCVGIGALLVLAGIIFVLYLMAGSWLR